MTLAAALDPPRSTRLAVSARTAILAAVLAVHGAAILALLTGAAPEVTARAQRALAVFDVALPPPDPPAPPPPPPPPTRPAESDGSPPLRRPAAVPEGGSPKPPLAVARAPDYAPVPREISFDVTPTLDTPPVLAGAAPLPGLIDGGGAGLGGVGTGAGSGRGDGAGAGGGGSGLGFGRARWIYQPRRYEMMGYFPAAARKANIPGRVLLACDVPKAGRPTACRSIGENPAGQGFGDAAVAMAKLFRIRPVLRNGQPMTDVPIIVPVDFELLGKPLPPRPPCPKIFCKPVPGYRPGLER